MRICYIGGKGSGSTRLCGPRRLSVELGKRLPHKVTYLRFSGLFSLPGMILRVLQYKPHVIHGHGSLNMALLLLMFKAITGRKTILTFTDFKKNVTTNYRILNWLDRVIVQTEYARKRLRHFGVKERKLEQIQYGVEERFYTAKVCQEIRSLGKKIVLYYGDARKERGFDTILKTIPLLKEYTVLLCIRNVYPEFRNALQNLQPNVKLLRVEEYPCEIQDIITSVDVVVLPFTHNTLEPPLTLMEVSAVGTPLVATNIGGNSEVVNATLARNATGEECAAAIRKARKTKRKVYDWNHVLTKMEDVYR